MNNLIDLAPVEEYYNSDRHHNHHNNHNNHHWNHNRHWNKYMNSHDYHYINRLNGNGPILVMIFIMFVLLIALAFIKM